MNRNTSRCRREDAIERAGRHSPFLREAVKSCPAIAEKFLGDGAPAAARLALEVTADDVETELRRRRTGLALAVALGDLAGELSLEETTRLLSDFADSAIDRALKAAYLERVPEADSAGFAVIAMGKLGSRELN